MADLLPNNFPLPAEGVLASYDATDILTGTGYITHYFFNAVSSAGDDYLISTEAVGELSASNIVGDNETETFYTPAFSSARLVGGTFIMYLETDWTPGGDGGSDGTAVVKVYHYDGTTSTQLGSTWTSASVKAYSKHIARIEIPVTRFNAGDKIKMEISATSTSTGTTIIHLESLYAKIPFKIEV